MHNGYINIDNKKMSKSLGNFFTIRDILEKYKPEVVRFFMLSAHYRSPVNFSDLLMQQAKSALERVYTCIDSIKFSLESSVERDLTDSEKELQKALANAKTRFNDAMDDDLNTADAISAIFDIVAAANKALLKEGGNAKSILCETLDTIAELGKVLGLFEKKEEASLDAEIEALIEKRNEARKNKDFAEADRIRDELKARNIILKDTPMGVTWSYAE
jgi:cysteinyl-tRNA synthetase